MSWSYLCASDFRPCTGLNILKEAQTSEGCLLGASGQSTGLQERVRLTPQTAEERRALQPPSFSLKYPMSPESLASFWVVVGRWNWVFPVLLCCLWEEILKRLWAVFGLCLALRGSLAWTSSLVHVFHSQYYDCSWLKSSSAPLPPTGLVTCGKEERDSVWNRMAEEAENMPKLWVGKRNLPFCQPQ